MNDVGSTFILRVRVYLEDTDAQGVVYNASYFRFMERARTDWLRARGIDHTDVHRRFGIALVLSSIEARFLAPATLGDELEITASVAEVRGARMVFEQSVFHADSPDVLVCRGKAEVACKDVDSGGPRRWPHELLRELKQ